MRPRQLPITNYQLLLSIAVALLIAAWLRFYRIDYQSYWNDEGNSLALAGRSVGAIWQAAAADIHPPGYYLALKGWRALMGPWELALRGFSALAGVALVALLYRLGREYFGPAGGLGAAFAGAFNPFLVYYAQEARMYALLAALSAASFLLFSLWLRSSRPSASPLGNWKLGLGYSLATAAGLYTHYAFGFVLLAQNVAALGGLLAHGRRASAAAPPGDDRLRSGRTPVWVRRLAAWLGWQALALLAFLPWLPVAYRQLSGWPAARDFKPFVAALVDLGRYLTFGRTLPAPEAAVGLIGAVVIVLFGLRRGGQTITPLIWLLIPAALTLAFGLLSETFAKFLLAAAPALILLLGQGLAAMPLEIGHNWKRRLAVLATLTLWLAAVGALGAATFAALNHLYFDPAYFRDDYRGIARHLASVERPGDAVITIAPNQVEAYGYYHQSKAPIYPLPHSRPLDPAETEEALAAIASQHPRIFVLLWGDEQADPERFVEKWLNTRAFKAGETWYGQVRLATYAAAQPAAEMATPSGARFVTAAGDEIILDGYTLRQSTVAPGEIVPIALSWRAAAPVRGRYKVFVHVYADVGAPPVAQQDGEPVGGLRPTTTWEPGQPVADNHGVLIPPDVPPGEYPLMVGLYDLFTGERALVRMEGQAVGDRLLVATITVR